ncbi:hypothetical protein [Nocardia sp. NPDC127526]|uniref:hypothetical protein n=1 Tax=Nocardia sp. NPDC127526 TaxID=3345393 RepID=UPI0036435633
MRPDLLALTDDSLVTLANRGILKRALKENAAAPPQLHEGPDGTVEAAFPDGTHTVLPPGITLDAAPCTCGATSVCRHRVMTVLAYRGDANLATAGDPNEPGEPATGAGDGTSAAIADNSRGGGAPGNGGVAGVAAADAGMTASASPTGAAANYAPPPEYWSPAGFTDEQLAALLGARAFTTAKRARRSGFRATVRRATAQDPVPSVELSAVTVRFLVPRDLGYARVDAARGSRTDAIALAVWAFRQADGLDPAAESLEVTVGDAADGSAAITAAASALTPLADLLADGVAHVDPSLPTVFAAALRTLDSAAARWPHDALTDLLDQLSAYRDRSARHDPLHTAALLTELVARHRASSRDWVPVLGTEEAAQTPLRHLRLTGLGARITGDAESRTVETYLAHPEARIVLTLHHTVPIPDGAEPPTATALGARRTGAARLSDLAAGNVVTESAVRSANRTVRLATSRVARTSVLPSTGDWSKLPPELLVTDLEAEEARQKSLPPSLIRPRVRGESIRVVAVEEITETHYLPGEQRLHATVHAPHGTATITHTHTGVAPGALDALAQALSGDAGPVRFIAGAVERHHGRLLVHPTAVVTGDTVLVPCFATTDRPLAPGSALPHQDPLAAAISSALDLTAEVPHRGTRHLPPTWFTRATDTSAALRRLSLASAATTLDTLRDALPAASPARALDLWATTHLRLLLTAEQL